MAKSSVTSTNDLRQVLIDTLDGVRDGSVTPAAANSISNLSGKILQSAKLDLEVQKLGIGAASGDGTKLITMNRRRR